MSARESYTGVVVSWPYRREGIDFRVAKFRTDKGVEMSVCGRLRCEEHVPVEIFGTWEEKPKYGRQFTVEASFKILPDKPKDLLPYLEKGSISGIGPERAKLLWARFGLNLLDILNHAPEKLAECPGIGEKTANKIAFSWNEDRLNRQVGLALASLSLSEKMIARIIEDLGADAVSIINKDPYRLMDVDGIGFQRADKIAMELGWTKDDPRRITAVIRFCLNEASSSGHTYLNREALLSDAVKRCDIKRELGGDAIKSLVSAGKIVEESVETKAGVLKLLFLKRLYEAETQAAEHLAELVKSKPGIPVPLDMDWLIGQCEAKLGLVLVPEQKQAVKNALTCSVSVLTGAPGTGKTSTQKVLLEVIRWLGISFVICAPTGRAARNIGVMVGAPAGTIHKTLGYKGDSREWEHHYENPLDVSLVIVDEISMTDIELFRNLISAIAPGTSLVMIGDKDQLPAVGPGRVIDDLIESGVIPVTRLTKIFRQAAGSRIIQNAHRILKGESMDFSAGAEGKTDCYQQKPPMIPNPATNKPIEDAEWIRKRISLLVRERIPALMEEIDPIRQIQILTPMKEGECGVYSLNKQLQDVLNPLGEEGTSIDKAGTHYRLKDRVLVTKNLYDVDVSNGDIGFITKIDREEEAFEIDFYGRTVTFPFLQALHLDLGYVLTVHKSQGSESEVVILVLTKRNWIMLQRNLLFTGVTRAKKLLIVFALDWVLNTAIRNAAISERNSYLKHRLRKLLIKKPAAAA